MSLERFLENEVQAGTYVSDGQFTLDLGKASAKLTAFALPSPNHFLLKAVQVAHQIRAERMDIKIHRSMTDITFVGPTPGKMLDARAIHGALTNPLAESDPLLKDLVSCLFGTLDQETVETRFWVEGPQSGHELVIDQYRQLHQQVQVLELPLPSQDQQTKVRLRVVHQHAWQFWKGARRRMESASLLRSHCRLSGTRLFIDGEELLAPPTSFVNDHLHGGYRDLPNLPIGSEVRVPASNIALELADEEEFGFGLIRPSLSAYLVRKDVMNVWASGMRFNNTLTPDGLSSAAWMLQFRRKGENISMRWARKRDRYRSVLALNIDNSGRETGLRVIVVRNGVLLVERSFPCAEIATQEFNGCTLIFADKTLKTDLTGFQVLESEDFLTRVASFSDLLEAAREYYCVGQSMMHIPTKKNAAT